MREFLEKKKKEKEEKEAAAAERVGVRSTYHWDPYNYLRSFFFLRGQTHLHGRSLKNMSYKQTHGRERNC